MNSYFSINLYMVRKINIAKLLPPSRLTYVSKLDLLIQNILLKLRDNIKTNNLFNMASIIFSITVRT